MKRIIDYTALDPNELVSQKGTKVLVGGCFDLLHIGHVRFLSAAKKQGDILIVALESDEFIKKRKKRQPFHNQKERAEILLSLSIVDVIILLPYFLKDEQYDLLVKKVNPQIIAVTENDQQLSKKQGQAEDISGKVVIVTAHIPYKASGNLLKAIRAFE